MRAMLTAIQLSEYGETMIEGYELTDEERRYLQKLALIKSEDYWEKRFYFDELKGGLRLRATSWVGVIELERVRVSIRPKFNHGFQSLLRMIGFVEKLPFHVWHPTSASWGALDMAELLVRYFLKRLDELWQKGLAKDYVTEEDNLKQLRGRPDMLRNMRDNLGFPNRIYCRYDELVTDQPENRVIRLALEIAARFRLRPETARKVNRYRSEFELLCGVHEDKQWPSFHYHRLNAHYEPVHRLARYIARQRSVNDLYQADGASFFSLLVDMNSLFEQFVGTFLGRYLPSAYRVEEQRRLTDAIQLNGASYRHIIPDLVVHDTAANKTIVLDVKYKNYGAKPVDTADMFQLAFYAQYYKAAEAAAHRSVIVFPQYADSPGEAGARIDLLPQKSARGQLMTRSLRIEEVLQLCSERNDAELRELALRLVDPFAYADA